MSGRNDRVLHAELVAVVPGRRSAQREQQHVRHAQQVRIDARRDPREIVIAEEPVRPRAGWHERLVRVDRRTYLVRRPLAELGQREVVRDVCLIELLAVVHDGAFGREHDLADHHALRVLVHDGPK
jgi:hypothetical protein